MMNSSDLSRWGEPFAWRGFAGRKGSHDGRNCLIIPPPHEAPGRPWIWRPEFFDAFANADEALVRRGFHLVFLDIPDHYGCPKALDAGDALYEFVTGTFGFAPKVAFVALSRAGLTAFNWAIRNPEKVSCIYADNPVCDFKSWPAGWGCGPGSAGDWSKCLAIYGMTEDDARAWPNNPVDRLDVLAKAGIPLLHVIGDADEVVPVTENSYVVRERYKALGGSYMEIIKPGGLHHPHGLPDPTPIAEFIVKHTR
ncbi:MAG: alpha/beta fold hydrolase [Chthoniobacteraceae bacterium]